MSEQVVFTPNDFQGSDAERINAAVNAAAEARGRVVIPRDNHAQDGHREIWLLDSAILVHSNTTLELNNCHIKLSDRCRDNMIRSANCGLGITEIEPMQRIRIYGVGDAVLEGADLPRATGDSGKALGLNTCATDAGTAGESKQQSTTTGHKRRRSYGTDAEVADESQISDWRNIGILMAFVEDFSISNLTIRESHCWAISLERCAHGTLRDLDFASTGVKMIDGAEQEILNQDGIDLRIGCHDILIENITGYSGDDLIALTALGSPDSVAGALASTQVSGGIGRCDGCDDIRNVIIRNVRGYSAGACSIIRLLNSSGLKLHGVLIDGLVDTAPPGRQSRAAVRLGDYRYGTGNPPVGDARAIIVTNISSRARQAILIGGSLCDSVIHNVISHGVDSQAVTIESDEVMLRDVTMTNIVSCADER